MADDKERLAIRALYYAIGYHDSNPEVGFGPFPESMLEDDILKPARVTLSKESKMRVVAEAKRLRGHR